MSWFCLKASWMSCPLASSIENPSPVVNVYYVIGFRLLMYIMLWALGPITLLV